MDIILFKYRVQYAFYQYKSINTNLNYVSDRLAARYGVPQGPILGPALKNS